MSSGMETLVALNIPGLGLMLEPCSRLWLALTEATSNDDDGAAWGCASANIAVKIVPTRTIEPEMGPRRFLVHGVPCSTRVLMVNSNMPRYPSCHNVS